MAKAHDILLEHLKELLEVRLVARLEDEQAVGNTNERHLHVFVPDLHLLSEDAQENYSLKFNWSNEFEKVTTALLNTRNHLWGEELSMKVYQLGDFVDLWRESIMGAKGVRDIMNSFPDIRDRFLRNSGDSLSARLLLGNHDLEARESRMFARARTVHYLTGTGWSQMALHGDVFDYLELFLPNIINTIVLQVLGRIPKPSTYPMEKLLDLQERYPPHDNQGDATFRATQSVEGDLPREFNVTTVMNEEDRSREHKLLPLAVQAAKKIRTEKDIDDKPIAPNLKVMVVGHTHHARLVVDKIDDLILMDCGAWTGNYRVGEQESQPNHQLGAICGSDLRIYQVD
jgi:UDP-2,3-diacylglucosamine pyrophosphatase LpxH